MSLPGFSAAATLGTRPAAHGGRTGERREDSSTVEAARIICSSNALAISCQILGGPFFVFPCFGNEYCVLAHAGFANPACWTCTVR
jgi:hypothetical protein